ncbi:hypothetical protein BDZ91DRAFT_738877 [Kalaharituber pfeilii]|nr:hypothetical protein BDZ91DRAFT_738877 [Kalaharituber pfeilii]
MRLWTIRAAAALLSASLPFSLQKNHEDPCAQIASEWAESDTAVQFPADLAQACLKSIPYDEKRSRFILDQLQLYFQFFAAQTYYKSPPQYFELLPVNANDTFEYFYDRLEEGSHAYANNLEFDHDLMNFFGSYRHASMQFLPACSGAFLFRHDQPLVAISPDTPSSEAKIYVVLDPYGIPQIGPEVDTIDGQPVIDYLKHLTSTLPSLQYVDPDARWNELFFRRSNADARLGAFAQRFVYPEGGQIIVKYKDGSEAPLTWTAEIFSGVAEMTPDEVHLPWSDKHSFLEKVCLRPMDPALCKRQEGSLYTVHKRGLHRKRDSHPTSMWGYPTPVLHTHGHELSLFEYDEYSVFVISSFDPHPGNTQDGLAFVLDFQETFWEALESVKEYDKKIGKKRPLLIDLSHNDGGRQILAHEAARMLLPNTDHYFLANRRWSPALKDLMTADFSVNHASVFNHRYYKNENGGDFKDAQDLLGPVYKDGDYFTKFMEPNHEEIIAELWGDHYVELGDAYWTASDLVVIADGLCQGACAILLEALQAQGVRVAAYGGRPDQWKMQGAGGLKGHSPAEFTKIDEEIYYILGVAAWDNPNMPKPLPYNMLWGSVGLENRFRKGESTPMEFQHLPATWTQKFTKDMFDGAHAIWQKTYSLLLNSAPDESQKKNLGPQKGSAEQKDSIALNNDDDDDFGSDELDLKLPIGDWNLGKYIHDFFDGYSPENIFQLDKFFNDDDD